MTPITPHTLTSPAELRTWALDGGELAVVDIREGGAYEAGHVSISVPISDSTLELDIVSRVPRRETRLVLVDASGRDDAGAVARLVALGYTQVSLLEGGLAAWAAAGHELITQPNSLSKALGEFIERRYATPRITVEQLKEKLDAREEILVLDTRPEAEFRHIAIPTGRLASGAELLYRVFDQLDSDDRQVVVNCAGRTRAIIGAQALLNAGLPNPVASLENGTTAWRLAGHDAISGGGDLIAEPSPAGLERAQQGAQRVRRRFGVNELDAVRLAALRAESDRRTLYLFDVRTPQEYAMSHLAGAWSAPGGQLVQATDEYVGTRGSRIVLVDAPDLVRSTITASWLLQMGLDEVSVYGVLPQDEVEHGLPASEEPERARHGTVITAEQLNSRLTAEERITVVDLQPESPYFETRRFIASSLVTRRSTLLRDPTALAGPLASGPVVLVSRCGRCARLSAAEVARHTGSDVAALAGGIHAWIEAGLPTEVGVGQEPLTERDRLTPPEDLQARGRSFGEYVAWGDQITEQLGRDGLVTFRAFDADGHD